LNGDLDGVRLRSDPFLGLEIPEMVSGVPPEVLNPQSTWADQSAYERQVKMLVGRFHENFKQFSTQVSAGVLEAGPTRLQV
jgi:phosphoenolpyruvate carboxykinase (ATP)